MSNNYAGLTLMKNGVRVNWSNVCFFRYRIIGDLFQIEFQWKYKVSIRNEFVTLNKMSRQDLAKYFVKWGLVPFGESSFINVNKILLIDEDEVIRGPIDYTKLRLVFTDGFEYREKLKSEYWTWWRSNHS